MIIGVAIAAELSSRNCSWASFLQASGFSHSMAYRSKSASMVLIASSAMPVVKRWSESLRGYFVSHRVEDAAALEHAMVQFKPPILLLDLALLGSGKIRSIGSLQRLSSATKIIVFTRTPNETEAVSVLKSGAKGYCPRTIEPALLAKVVKLVESGEIWAGRKLIPALIQELTSLIERRQRRSRSEVHGGFDALTQRQREIVSLIGRGARNRDIANRINMSEKTVKAHLTTIFRKVGVSNRIGLAIFANEYRRLAVSAPRLDKGLFEQDSDSRLEKKPTHMG